MKKKFAKIKLAFQMCFLVFLSLMSICWHSNPQEEQVHQDPSIDFTATGGCPNKPDTLPGQVKGRAITTGTGDIWDMPSPITAYHTPGGAAHTMSIRTISAKESGVEYTKCDPCSGIETIDGITFTTSGANFTITGTPTIAPITYYITVRASAGGVDCDRTYTLNIYATVADRGDPHITTTDGVNYDFQAVGEFTLLRGESGESFEIQTRQTAVATNGTGTNSYTGLSTCVSLNTAVAAQVGKHRVTYQPNIIDGRQDPEGMQLRVDGNLTTIGENGLDLGSGGRIVKLRAPGNGIVIDFPNGASLVATPNWWSSYSVWYLNVDVYRTMATKGIAGVIVYNDTAHGNSHRSKSWLPALPDGSSLGPMPRSLHDRFVQLNTTFADAWRVTDKTSLFDYAPGTSTATFTNKNWPAEHAQSCNVPGQTPLTPINLAEAQKLCRDIVDPTMRTNAIFDVMLTGEPGFAKSYLLTQRVMTGTTAIRVSASKDTTKYKESVTLTATVYRKFSAGKDMLTGSVEFFVDGKKFDQEVKLEANGRALLTTTSLEAGQHQIAAKFMPDARSTAFSSSSLEITHTVLDNGGIIDTILHLWWLWLLVFIVIITIYIVIKKKKKL
jgi:hypothetical protein